MTCLLINALTTSQPFIWAPFLYPDIINIREINNVYGDGISVGFIKGRDTSTIYRVWPL